MDSIVHGVTKSQTQLSDFSLITYIHTQLINRNAKNKTKVFRFFEQWSFKKTVEF